MTLQQITEQITQLQQELDLIRSFERAGDLNLISETVLSASVASVTFSSIPNDFRSLLLILQGRSDAALETDPASMRFNGDTGSNYDRLTSNFITSGITHSASRAASSIIAIARFEAASSRASVFAPVFILIPNYTLTTREKTAFGFSSSVGDLSADADLIQSFSNGLWRDTSAITSITFIPVTGTNFVADSIFALYGIF